MVFRRQYDGIVPPGLLIQPEEQVDRVERAGYRSTEQMVASLMSAGQRLMAFRATEFTGDMNPGPFQGSVDQVDLDARMDTVVKSGLEAVERVQSAASSARAVERAKKIEEAKALLKEAHNAQTPAPQGDGQASAVR